MILMKDIILEDNPILHQEAKNVEVPLSQEDRNTLVEMLGYLINSQNNEKALELGLRPGVGLAAPQIGISKKMFTILTNDLEGKLWVLAVVNPKIVNASKEMIYLPGGEGCLSVDRETTGITPRHKYITVEAYFYNPNKGILEHKKLTLRDYVAIVFQHEYDHLFGTLYVDKLLTDEEAKNSGIKPLWNVEQN